MQPLTLKFINWRLFEESSFEIPAQNTLIVGENGAGKTTILAGLYALYTGQAWPGTTWRQQIKTGAQYFGISATEYPNWFVSGLISPYGRVVTRYGSEISGEHDFTALTYIPDDNRWLILARSPKLSLLDQALIAVHGNLYSTPLKLLERATTSKTKLIKKYHEEGALDTILLTQIHDEIVAHSQTLWGYRSHFLLEFEQAIGEYVTWIESPIDSYKIRYTASFGSLKKNAFEELSMPLYSVVWSSEIAANRVLYGAQRDDFGIEFNSQAAEVFLSRGESRALAIFFKRFVRNKLPGNVLWLLDDFFNEFDAGREQEILAKLVKPGDWIVGSSTRQIVGFESYLSL